MSIGGKKRRKEKEERKRDSFIAPFFIVPPCASWTNAQKGLGKRAEKERKEKEQNSAPLGLRSIAHRCSDCIDSAREGQSRKTAGRGGKGKKKKEGHDSPSPLSTSLILLLSCSMNLVDDCSEDRRESRS